MPLKISIKLINTISKMYHTKKGYDPGKYIMIKFKIILDELINLQRIKSFEMNRS